MKVNKLIGGFSAPVRVMVLCLVALFVPVTTICAQTRSIYVRADGDDNNNGRSEDTPYRTLAKAVDAAKAGVLKQITVLGKIDGTRISDTGVDDLLITGIQAVEGGVKSEILSLISLGKAAKVQFSNINLAEGLRLEYNDNRVTLGAGSLVLGEIAFRTGGSLVMTDDATVSGGITSGPRNSRPVITMSGNARIANNIATGNGGGINAGDKLTLTMSDDTEISGNTAKKDGGGIYAQGGLTLIMSGNARIANNTASGNGGGVRATADRIALSGNAQISDNTASGNGGGIYVRRGKITLVDGVRISGNTSGKDGGGIYSAGVLNINAGEISGNTAKNGGGVFVAETSASVTGGTISGNSADYGAGVYAQKGAAFIFNNGSITGNEAGFAGGGVYAQIGSTYTVGSGTVTDNTAGDSEITGNTAGDGGDNVFRHQ